MTDTGQVPGEGQPESAGMVEQPGVTAHGAYTYLSEAPAEDEDLLLPGAQGAWGNEVPPPAPEPVVEALHEPGPHEAAGRDTGSVDLGGVRLPSPHETMAPRRPLHLGPPIPNASASPVRSLADRGPEYLDAQPLREMVPQSAAPWGAAPGGTAVGMPAAAQVPGTAEAVPVAAGTPGAEAPALAVPGTADAADAPVAGQVPGAETVDPAVAGAPDDIAGEAAVNGLAAPVAAQASAAEQVVQGQDGPQPAEGHDGVYAPRTEEAVPVAAEPAQVPVAQVAEATAVAAQPVQEALVAEAPGAPEAGAPVQAEVQVPGAVEDARPTEPVAVEAVQVAEPVEPVVVEAVQAAQPVEPVAVEAVQAAQPGEPVAVEAPVAVAAEVPVVPAPVPHQLPDAAGQPVAEPVEPVAVDAVQAAEPVAVEAVPAVEPAAVEAVQAADAVQPVAAPVEQAEATEAPVAPAPVVHQVQGPQSVEPAAQDAEPVPSAPQPGGPPPAPAPAPVEAQPLPQPTAQDQTGPAVPPAEPVPAGDPAVPTSVPGPEQPAEAVPAPVAAVAVDPQAAVAAEAEAPQPRPAADPAPVAPAQPQDASAPVEAPAPQPAVPAEAPGQPAPAAEQVPGVPLEPGPEQPLGEFVPVEGQVPSTPHLAPTPPHPLVLPAQGPAPQATVPAPREAEAAPHATTPEPAAAAQEPAAAAQGETPAEAAPAPAPGSTGPAAPGYDDAEREAVLKVMRERRDIRNGFRNDPIPHEVLLRVLEAAHTAPSVGHSQPWDFVVIRSAETRNTMHELAMRQREAYAKSLPKGRAKQFKELKIEAILDTPVNIVVTADPTRGGRHTLGRYTQPQMAPYSAALAVENLWLAARAEGLGVGWVSFFDEREMVRALGLPEHLEVIAYLCVGYVDEFPDEPELMQAGWSKRRPLSWVVHEETYGRRALPGEEPHDLLAETVAQIRPLDAKALGEAWERQKRMTKPAGALGMLEIISAQLSGLSRQCPPPIPEPAAVAIFAGDHGVHAQGVTPWPQEVTGQMVANFLGGGAVCNAFAAQVGAEVCVVDVGVATDLPATPGLLPRKIRGGTSDMTAGPAMTREEAKAAIEVGIETARDLVAASNKALLTGEMGIANTTASAALISVFTGVDPAEVTGRGTGINDETLARKTEVVRRALELHQPDLADPVGVLAAIGGFEHAAMVGLLLGGASLRTPVILDGVSAGAAALVARAIAPEVLAACIAGHRSAEPGHVAALNKLGLRPLVDLDLRLGEGTGALLALPLVQSAARAMHEVATFDSAGVTEK
ncbi:nicotinate-nucleotide--dimethylbenzimidazole phosphoribosyltransferase [Streptomyces sp. NPDC001056]